jgi:hypothetical protein
MSFRASGRKPPGFASAAPAPATAAIEAVARPLIRSLIPCSLAGFGGRLSAFSTHARIATAATTSSTATQLFGVESFDAATSPITNAAATPIASVAVRAPT